MAPKRVKAAMESNNIVDIDSPEYKTDDFRMYSLKVRVIASLVAPAITMKFR